MLYQFQFKYKLWKYNAHSYAADIHGNKNGIPRSVGEIPANRIRREQRCIEDVRSWVMSSFDTMWNDLATFHSFHYHLRHISDRR